MANSADRRQPGPRLGIAIAEQGMVLLDGPQGAVSTLTPEEAAATGESLRLAASLAAQQRTETPQAGTLPFRRKSDDA